MPAWLVFYATAGFTALSTALVYLRGARFLALSVFACLLTLAVLVIDERTGFTNSRRLRRSGEQRVNLAAVETVVLFGLLMAGVYVSVLAWLK